MAEKALWFRAILRHSILTTINMCYNRISVWVCLT